MNSEAMVKAISKHAMAVHNLRMAMKDPERDFHLIQEVLEADNAITKAVLEASSNEHLHSANTPTDH